jgi:hypothetical protein
MVVQMKLRAVDFQHQGKDVYGSLYLFSTSLRQRLERECYASKFNLATKEEKRKKSLFSK